VGSLPAKTGARIVAIDPQHPRRVYGVGETGRVYRSDDAGQTWSTADRGLPPGTIVALALDPRHPQRLYAAATSGALYVSEGGEEGWRALGHRAGDAVR
jgi:photosystem II stability/assembly factor-like uncharacterized protein